MAITELPAPEGELRSLHLSLDSLATDFLPTVPVDELGNRAISLQLARQKLDAIQAATIAEAESAGVSANAQQRTMAQFVASRTHCNPEDIRADNRTGVWSRQFAQFEAAAFAGQLSRRHLNLLRSTDNIRVHVALQRDQAMLLGFVETLEWTSYTNAIAYWLLVNDPDGQEPKVIEAKNSCTATKIAGGRVKLIAYLDPVTGDILMQHLGIEEDAVFAQDTEDGVPRTAGQRRAEALGNLVTRGAGRTENSATPLVHVVMSLKVMLHAIAQLAKPASEQDFVSVVDPNDVDGRCELIDGTPIHPKYALVLLMQARIRRQVLTAQSKTLNASVKSRLFPTWMKHIRLVETRGQCETAGCDAPFSWLRADHKTPYSKTQRTTLEDLANICDPDNKKKGVGPPLAEREPPRPQGGQEINPMADDWRSPDA